MTGVQTCALPIYDKIKKEISFGVNDTREKRDGDKEKFRNGQYMEIKSITFRHGTFGIDFGMY